MWELGVSILNKVWRLDSIIPSSVRNTATIVYIQSKIIFCMMSELLSHFPTCFAALLYALWITKPFCTRARRVSCLHGERKVFKRYAIPTSALSILCGLFGCVRDSHCSSLCRWLSEQQPAVIALHSSFHAHGYFMSQEGKTFFRNEFSREFSSVVV